MDLHVDDFALAPAERRLLECLHRRGVPFLVIGMSAALIQGAPMSTQDIDLWFESASDERIRLAATDAGAFWISGFGLQPPGFGGQDLERIEVVLTAHGLDAFSTEYQRSHVVDVEGLKLRVLPLARIIASKRATKRPQDIAALPALEATLAAQNALTE